MGVNALLEPYRLGPYLLKNRVVMSPMTRSRSPGEIPNELNAEYYAQRAGAGLIVVESTAISAQGLGWIDSPGVYTPEQIRGWRVGHRRGARPEGPDLCPALAHGPLLPRFGSARRTVAGGTFGRSLPRQVADPARPSRAFSAARNRAPTKSRALLINIAAPPPTHSRRDSTASKCMPGMGTCSISFCAISQIAERMRMAGRWRTGTRLTWEVMRAVAEVCGRERVGIRISPTNTHHDMSDSDPETLFFTAVSGLNGIGPVYLHVVEGATPPGAPQFPFNYRKLRSLFRGNLHRQQWLLAGAGVCRACGGPRRHVCVWPSLYCQSGSG